MRLLLSLPLIVAVLFSSAQDLNGIWRGKLIQEAGGCYPEYNLELQINFIQTANTITGRAYDYYDTTRYVKLDFSGRFNATTKRMVLIENNLMESKIPVYCVPCVKTFDLTWSRSGGDEVLTGESKGREFGSNKACPSYKLTLK
ncbi:MAG: hypothetical protein H7Y27_04145, partial [Gemmatimonadaceae bacterium]|nr:hypothetical protein [Chitinophagaceae bacterium]